MGDDGGSTTQPAATTQAASQGASGGAEVSASSPANGGDGISTGGASADPDGGAATAGDEGDPAGSSATASPGSGSTGAGGGGPGNCDGGSMAAGFYVEGDTLYDSRCNPFVMRGVNYPYAWYRDATQQRFADIAGVGANTVRVVLATGGQWDRVSGSEVADIIGWAKANRLVAVLEVHDSTGWSESAGAVHPDQAVDYWLSEDIRDAIDGEEAYVIINIANEPFGNTTTEEWASFHAGAVAELRGAGIEHTLMVDAPNWGQDWTNTMRDGDGAQTIFDADPDRNVVFAIHMYNVYGTSSTVEAYFTNFGSKGLPLVVGEFAADHGAGEENEVAEDAIMQLAEERDIGYLGWSWSGNSAELASLDVTQGFAVGSLTPWGEALIHGANGIASTSEVCSCFGE